MSSSVRYIPPSAGGLYRHYRNRQMYQVILVVPMHETDDLVVVYSPAYGTAVDPNKVYGRFLEEFQQKFQEVPDGLASS